MIVLILPFIPIFIGYLLIKRKLRIIRKIKNSGELSNQVEKLEALAKIDKYGAMFYFIKSIEKIDEFELKIFNRLFKGDKNKIKFYRLSRYFKRENDYNSAVYSLYFADKIDDAIELSIEKELLMELREIIEHSEIFTLSIWRMIFRKLIEISDYNLLLQIIKNRINPDILEIISEVLMEKFLQNFDSFQKEDDESLIINNFINSIIQKVKDDQLNDDKEIAETIELFEKFKEIITIKNMDLKEIFYKISILFIENKKFITENVIHSLIISLSLLSGGLTPNFFSLYDMFKFQILEESELNIEYLKKIFEKSEIMSLSALYPQFKVIINEISNEFKGNNSQNLSYNDFFKQHLFNYFSYSSYSLYKHLIIKLLIESNKKLKYDEKRGFLNEFYLKISNDYWNSVLNKIHSDDLEIDFHSSWNESKKKKYILHIIKQIALLRAIILYKTVDFRVLTKNDAYDKVIQLLNSISKSFENKYEWNQSINSRFIDEILIKSGWSKYTV
ncbi:MAG: hypothetical protein EU551_01475 [Promethearchaeota archaeon]|nr:MAG: hypothetical protein EU551_01475 [Candidatus Lokiarchaeota archaeon]